MSTYWDLELDVPLSVPLAIAEPILREALSHYDHRATHNLWTGFSVDVGLPIRDMEEFESETGISFEEGRFRTSLFVSNFAYSTGPIGARVERATILMDALAQVTSAPVGTIIGALRSEHEPDKGPILITAAGVRWCNSTGDHRMHQGWGAVTPEADPLVSIPTEVIEDDGDGWQCTIDRARLREMVRDGMVAA